MKNKSVRESQYEKSENIVSKLQILRKKISAYSVVNPCGKIEQSVAHLKAAENQKWAKRKKLPFASK